MLNVQNLIVVNTVRVKQKETKRSGGLRTLILAFCGGFLLIAIGAAAVAYEWTYDRFGVFWERSSIETTATGRVIKVPPGGNINSALEMAQSGDIVELQAGAVYPGTISLPNKPLTDFVTIRSSAIANLPENKRVSPAQRAQMATITGGMLGRAAVTTEKGAHHYRFVGIEFASSGSMFNYGLIVLGNGETAANLPHHIEIDRSYITSKRSTGKVRRGIALNSADTAITNSYIEGFGYASEETQGICGWTGTRNIKIINNYIEGGAENIMFGGADPASSDLIPADIEVRGNELNKPEAWKEGVTVKTLFELKNSKRVQFIGNYLRNNWVGSAFRITVRNQDGKATFSTIEDTVIKDNIVDGAGDGINILGKDDMFPSQTLKNLTIENNLFLNVGNGFEGKGYFIQVADGENITIANNTAFSSGSSIVFYGVQPKAFVFRDNIVNHGDYGFHGIDRRSPAARSMIRNNLILNLNKVSDSDFAIPDGNTLVQAIGDIGFADAAAKDFRLGAGSRFKGRSSTGKDPGSSLAPPVR